MCCAPPWLALLAYCVKSGMVTAARLISPTRPAVAFIDHWRGTRKLSAAGGASRMAGHPRRSWFGDHTTASLWLKPFIATQVKAGTTSAHAGAEVYSVYAIPPTRLLSSGQCCRRTSTCRLARTADDIDISLAAIFHPPGGHSVERLSEQIRLRGIQYAVVSGLNLKEQNVTLDSWLLQANATLISTTNATVKVTDGPQPWHIVRFQN